MKKKIIFQKFAPMFLVDNIDKVVKWYQDVLGAEIFASLPKNPPYEWVSLRLGDVEIMFSLKKSAQNWYSKNVVVSEKLSNFIGYIYVQDIDGLYQKIEDKVKVIMEPVDQPYGIREFAIKDPFGITLIFAQIIT